MLFFVDIYYLGSSLFPSVHEVVDEFSIFTTHNGVLVNSRLESPHLYKLRPLFRTRYIRQITGYFSPFLITYFHTVSDVISVISGRSRKINSIFSFVSERTPSSIWITQMRWNRKKKKTYNRTIF